MDRRVGVYFVLWNSCCSTFSSASAVVSIWDWAPIQNTTTFKRPFCSLNPYRMHTHTVQKLSCASDVECRLFWACGNAQDSGANITGANSQAEIPKCAGTSIPQSQPSSRKQRQWFSASETSVAELIGGVSLCSSHLYFLEECADVGTSGHQLRDSHQLRGHCTKSPAEPQIHA